MKTKVIFLTICLAFISFSYHSSFAQTTCKEEKVGKSYFTVCPDNIVIEKKKVLLTTKAVAKKIDNKNTYKLVDFYVADRKTTATDETFLASAKFLNSLETHTFMVNGSEFTGVLKLAVGFKNEGSSSYSGYDLLTYEFRDGKFISKSKAEDVEIEKEKKVVR